MTERARDFSLSDSVASPKRKRARIESAAENSKSKAHRGVGNDETAICEVKAKEVAHDKREAQKSKRGSKVVRIENLDDMAIHQECRIGGLSMGKFTSNSPNIQKSKVDPNLIVTPAQALLRNRNAVTEVASVDGENVSEEIRQQDAQPMPSEQTYKKKAEDL